MVTLLGPRSQSEGCVCCRNVVVLFSLFILLVEGDLDSNGEI